MIPDGLHRFTRSGRFAHAEGSGTALAAERGDAAVSGPAVPGCPKAAVSGQAEGAAVDAVHDVGDGRAGPAGGRPRPASGNIGTAVNAKPVIMARSV
ncbi:hypothetical protein GCM10010340_57310 [Streptomyces griseoloalbus]|nr:hypothetical protein GCM10010340_57310 [Streptomyces albaduncus]